VKSLVKKLLRGLDYEIRRAGSKETVPYGLLPPWIAEPKPVEDEVIKEGWIYHALQMANRNYRPPQLAYYRTQYGEDQRIKYIAYFLDLRDKRVLELGPLEGHHSIILEKLGVRENIAVESRADNLAKCNRVKEKYRLDRTTFVHQDLENLYRGKEKPHFSGPFDLVFCCGLLYHFPDPLQALRWFREQSTSLFLGTHYVETMEIKSYQPPTFADDGPYRDHGHQYAGLWAKEGGEKDPISGMSSRSFWPYEADLLAMLRDAGYANISVLGKDLQNHSPHITLLAEAQE
jgi:SAM-dependent methyltransferase